MKRSTGAWAGLVTVCSLFLGGAKGFAEPPTRPLAEVVKLNAEAIRQVLPASWTVQTEGSVLKVIRDEPVEWYNPNASDDCSLAQMKAAGLVQQSKYVIALEFAPPITQSERDRLKAENGQTDRQMTLLDNKIRDLEGIYSPYAESWRKRSSRTDEERQLRAEYDKLKASLHRVPLFVMPDASVFLSQSVGTYTLFYSDQVHEECRRILQVVEAVLARQANPSHATRTALMARFADAIDARDEKAMLACFRGIAGPNTAAVSRILAALRLRDAMEAQFGREAAEKVLTDPRFQVPDTKRLRTARGFGGSQSNRGRIYPEDNDPTLDTFFQTNGIGASWDSWDRPGWYLGVGVPASVNLTNQMVAESQRWAKQVTKVAGEVQAGRYQTTDEVVTRLQARPRPAQPAQQRVE